MHIVNVNIPPWFPNQPYLSVPLLTGILREEGYSVYQKDINLSFYDNLLSKDEIQYQYNTLIRNNTKVLEPKQKLLLDLQDFFIENVEVIKNRTHQKDSFRSKEYANNLFHDLELILKIYTISFPEVELSLGEIKYNFDYLNPNTLSQYLESKNNIFRYYLSKYELQDIIDQKPNIVAISVTTPEQLIPALSLASLLKINMSEVKILLGGDYISRVFNTIVKHEILQHFVDFILVGNAEKSIVDLCTAIKNRNSFHNVSSLIWKNGSGFVFNSVDNSFSYNNLQHPDFDGLQLKDYFFPEIYLPIEVSKGCYWGKCTFCEIKGKPYFQKKASQIKEEMVCQNEKYEASHFAFVSSSPSPRLLFKLSEKIAGLGFIWSAFIRPEPYINEDFANVLYHGGCRILYVGIESGSQSVLDLMQKGTNIKAVKTVLENLKAVGIKTHGYFMFGFTGETDEDRKITNDFISENKNLFHSISFSSYVEPYKCNEYHDGLYIYKTIKEYSKNENILKGQEDNNKLYFINLNLEMIYGN